MLRHSGSEQQEGILDRFLDEFLDPLIDGARPEVLQGLRILAPPRADEFSEHC